MAYVDPKALYFLSEGKVMDEKQAFLDDLRSLLKKRIGEYEFWDKRSHDSWNVWAHNHTKMVEAKEILTLIENAAMETKNDSPV